MYLQLEVRGGYGWATTTTEMQWPIQWHMRRPQDMSIDVSWAISTSFYFLSFLLPLLVYTFLGATTAVTAPCSTRTMTRRHAVNCTPVCATTTIKDATNCRRVMDDTLTIDGRTQGWLQEMDTSPSIASFSPFFSPFSLFLHVYMVNNNNILTTLTTRQPVLRVRVWRGFDKPNPYPDPRSTRGTHPWVSRTRDNPYWGFTDILHLSQ
jgi:hypothetical protein